MGGTNNFIIGLLWITGGMQNVTITDLPSSAKGTSSKFVNMKILPVH